MTTLLATYLTGIAWLLLLDYADRIHLEALVRAFWSAVTRRYRYAGRHCAGDEWSTSQCNVALAQAREETVHSERARLAVVAALREPTVDMLVPDLDVGPGHYDLSAGTGHYGRLRPALLDAAAEKARERPSPPVVDLKALRVRGAVPMVGEVEDAWWAAEVVAS